MSGKAPCTICQKRTNFFPRIDKYTHLVREISDVASISVPHARNGCLSMLATVFPPLAMYSHLKITGVVRSAKGGYRKVTVRYFYVNDPQFTAVQIRNRMNAVPPAQQ